MPALKVTAGTEDTRLGLCDSISLKLSYFMIKFILNDLVNATEL